MANLSPTGRKKKKKQDIRFNQATSKLHQQEQQGHFFVDTNLPVNLSSTGTSLDNMAVGAITAGSGLTISDTNSISLDTNGITFTSDSAPATYTSAASILSNS